MPRRPREQIEGGVYHVFARGNGRQPIFVDDVDRLCYLGVLGSVVCRRRWNCLAYCLMGNHVHLLVETPEPNLARGMQALQSFYAQTFNERHGRSGHVFEGRYGAKRAHDDGQLRTAAAYIARNPVAAGRCHRAEDWRWSSHAATLDQAGPAWLAIDRLLEFFAALGGDPVERYRAIVEMGSDPLSRGDSRGLTPERAGARAPR
jgi:putative transposase